MPTANGNGHHPKHNATSFKPGNPGGPGNVHGAAHVGRLRAAALGTVDPFRFGRIFDRIARIAEDEDASPLASIAAANFVADRLIGRPVTPILVADDRDAFLRAVVAALRLRVLDGDGPALIEAEVVQDGS